MEERDAERIKRMAVEAAERAAANAAKKKKAEERIAGVPTGHLSKLTRPKCMQQGTARTVALLVVHPCVRHTPGSGVCIDSGCTRPPVRTVVDVCLPTIHMGKATVT